MNILQVVIFMIIDIVLAFFSSFSKAFAFFGDTNFSTVFTFFSFVIIIFVFKVVADAIKNLLTLTLSKFLLLAVMPSIYFVDTHISALEYTLCNKQLSSVQKKELNEISLLKH